MVEKIKDSIPKLSYEPIGKQVKKIMYCKYKDKNGVDILPVCNYPLEDLQIQQVAIEEIIVEVKKVLT